MASQPPQEDQEVWVPAGFFDVLDGDGALPASTAGPLVDFLVLPAAEPPTGFLFADRATRGLAGPPHMRLPRREAAPQEDLRVAEGKEMRMFSVEVAKILLVSR